MGTLAHVIEAAGLATVVISQVRGQAERLHPPRVLHCEFPIGRTLGKPNDPAFQRRVLDSAFALLQEPSGPVLVDFPEVIEDAAATPLACALPPRNDTGLPEAVDEAKGLRAAYERTLKKAGGRTQLGRAVDADAIPDAVGAFVRIAEGTPWADAGLPGHPLQVSKDITAYYEEAAAAMVDHVPEARAAESWFFQKTAAGKALHGARKALSDAGEKFAFYLLPFTQAAAGE